jgi:hypothetical protein
MSIAPAQARMRKAAAGRLLRLSKRVIDKNLRAAVGIGSPPCRGRRKLWTRQSAATTRDVFAAGKDASGHRFCARPGVTKRLGLVVRDPRGSEKKALLEGSIARKWCMLFSG